jgi:hypothetical protein
VINSGGAMKKLFVGLIFLAFNLEAACPKLAGNYEYGSQSSSLHKMEIEQDTFKTHELYFFSLEPHSWFENQYIRTDGKTHHGLIADQFEYDYKARCEKEKLVLTLTRVLDPAVVYNLEYYLDNTGDLIIKSHGKEHSAKKK